MKMGIFNMWVDRYEAHVITDFIDSSVVMALEGISQNSFRTGWEGEEKHHAHTYTTSQILSVTWICCLRKSGVQENLSRPGGYQGIALLHRAISCIS